MTIREQISDYIDNEHKRLAFTPTFAYHPTLAFKLTNDNSDLSKSFEFDSVDDAEDLVISFISTAKKGKIFINDEYKEDKQLFLKVLVIVNP